MSWESRENTLNLGETKRRAYTSDIPRNKFFISYMSTFNTLSFSPDNIPLDWKQ